MAETARYTSMKDKLKETIVMNCVFKKYGSNFGTTEKATLLTRLTINGEEVMDHIWCDSVALQDARLQTGDKIKIQARILLRKRASEDLYGGLDLDIKLDKLEILFRFSRKRKKGRR